MAGPIVLVLVLLVAFPPMLFVGGALFSAALGWLLADHADAAHPDSPYRDLNR